MLSETIVYQVPAIHCSACEAGIEGEVGSVEGVESVEVDLERKLVTVRGSVLDDERLRAAIGDAGFEVV
jgi:copper chaperone